MSDLPPKPIALLGMRCAGKTRVGWVLSERTGRAFVDLDEALVRAGRQAGFEARSAGELLDEAGLAVFRDLEARALRHLLEPSLAIVLATGGGAIERADNRAWLRRAAFCVWLDVPLDVLRQRLAASGSSRPALSGLAGGDPVAELPMILARREPLYRDLAQLVIAAGDDSPARVADAILAGLG